ncbi:MAG: VWA domain-containing protein [Planctomycetes bacterium]|nr:VWA domain-containing protein [Planctomycetota bacterium]
MSALFLWRVDDRESVAGRKRERLVQSASLWCEIAAALALALCFAGPRASCVAAKSEHLVVVLDSSASMGAVRDERSTAQAALELVRKRIDSLPRGSRVTLVRSGSRPALLAGPAAFPDEARARLDEWKPLAARHDLHPSLALGLELAGGGRVLVVSDQFEPEAFPASVELVSVGEPLDNWALVHAVRSREARATGGVVEKVFLSVASFARAPRRLPISVRAGGAEIARQEVSLGARERAHLSFEVPAGVGALEVLLPTDGLECDNVALLVPPSARTLALHSELPESDLRALGLADPGEPNIARWTALVPHSTAAGDLAGAHLVLARGVQSGPASWTLSFEPQGESRRDLIGPFLVERGHPLLAGVTLEGLVWSIDPQLVLPGVPLVSAGNQAILTEERSGARVLWRINLDPARSSLQRSPDWPILLANLAELRRAELPGAVRPNLHIGESVRYRPGAELVRAGGEELARYELEGPLGASASTKREVAALEEVVVDGLEEPGLYRLSHQGRPVADFALSYVDAAESDLSTALPGARAAEGGSAELDTGLSGAELALVALAALALLLDWWFLRRSTRALPGVS